MYNKEVERPENVQWDDDSWKGFKADFEQLEKDDFAPVLNEKQLMSQIGEQTLGKEIVSEVDGHAGIFS